MKFFLAILLCILFINCKSNHNNKLYASELKLTENLADFTSKMTEKDTIKIAVKLDMEWWTRRDEILITKKSNEIQLQTTIKEDTSFTMKNHIRTTKLAEKTIANSDYSFEKHFTQKINEQKGM
ncbi:hypothetical protein [Aquimarina brevivitae]|uniref:Uncharacterized protein n=1 Tax=Aquimarina brevivitae TaxID=323412 RepID=A0A4Q7PII6_9FLAO|nr:hypothetical protein [Aquimarina brevivitae]RZT00068.1 hypothetical protein EV197_1298 [Aquimarina brevivitae]